MRETINQENDDKEIKRIQVQPRKLASIALCAAFFFVILSV